MTYLIPDRLHLMSLAATGLVALACIGVGYLGGARRPATALVAGWGIAGLATVAVGTLSPVPLDVVVIGLGCLGAAGLVRASMVGFEPGALGSDARMLLLSAPLLLIVSAMSPSQYDDFSHWLPNLGYLIVHDRFPSAALPNAASVWPAYPYGLPLLGYAASMPLGRMIETSAPIWNVLLLVAAGSALMRVAALRLEREGNDAFGGRSLSWPMAAVGLLAGGLMSPSFVPRIAFSNSADNAEGVIVAVLLGLVLEATWGEPLGRRRRLVVAGWCAAALVNTRQDAVVPLFLLAAGVALALGTARTLRGEGRWRDYLLALPAPILTTLLWRYYAAREIPGGEFTVLPLAQWHWALLPDALRSMGQVAVNKGGMFALLLIVSGAAVVALSMPRRFTPLQRVASIASAAVALGNIAFLVCAYLAVNFYEAEVRAAGSFWRYSAHGGEILTMAAVALIPTRWFGEGRFNRPLGVFIVIFALALPLATVRFLRFDLQAHTPYLRAEGHEIAELAQGADRIALVDEEDDGSNLNQVRYQILVAEQVDRRGKPPALDVFERGVDPAAESAVHDARFLWTYEGTPALRALTALALEPRTSYLLEKTAEGYRILHRQEFPASWVTKKSQGARQ